MGLAERVVNTKAIIVLIVVVGIALAAVAMPDEAHGTSSAELAALSISVGTLSPAFDADTLSYTITGLSNSDDQVTVTATPASGYNVSIWVGHGKGGCGGGAWVRNRPFGEASTGSNEPLKVGRNVVEIYVAEAETPHEFSPGVRTYKLYVVRPGTLSISGPTTASHPEKDTSTIATYSVPDATGTISWAQDGDDSGGPGYTKFSISDSGALSFAYSHILYEHPSDCDGDNVYEVTLWAYEGGDVVALLDVAVTVTGNDPAQGAPTITGTDPPQVGQTLTADTSGISDPNGLDNVTYSYRWQAVDTIYIEQIDGATSSTYTVQSSDVGKAIRVHVTFTDDAGYAEGLFSEYTSDVVLGGL